MVAGVMSVLLMGLVLLLAPAPATAQDQDGPSPRQLLEDFNHYTRIDQYEMAAASARALLDSDLSPERFLGLVEDSPNMLQNFERAYGRAMSVPQLEPLAARLWSLYTEGRSGRARNPEEIDRNIESLDGTLSQQLFAKARLGEAREYAVPQLLDAALRGETPKIQANAVEVLQEMGRPAAVVLSEALLSMDAASQVRIANILGQIDYPVSVPYLYELYAGTNDRRVREAIERAVRRITGDFDPTLPVAGLYRELADRYFADRTRGSLISFPGETHQVLWEYLPGVGLTPTAVITELFNEAMAMRHAKHALELDPTDTATLSLWLAANFAREIEQPADYDNPTYRDKRDPMYYAVAAGTGPSMRVLARALYDKETVLARRAIAALSRSTGGEGLLRGMGDDRPLLAALSYPDRRVQYDAALAIGRAFPTRGFEGAERVTPILAGLIGDASKRYAVVIASDVSRQQEIRSNLESEGYTVLAPATTLRGAGEAIARAPVVDLIVTDVGGRTLATIEEIRRTGRLAATPVLALMPWTEVNTNRARMADDHLTRLAREGLTSAEMAASVEQLVQRASGDPVTQAEAREYAIEALDVLRSLAIGGNEVLNVRDAASALIASLGETSGEVKMRVAEVMSYIASRRVQVSLMNAALTATGGERIALLGAVADSAKRHGNLLEGVQVSRLVDLAQTAQGDEATAAAALMGALDLSNDQLVPLIIEGSPGGPRTAAGD